MQYSAKWGWPVAFVAALDDEKKQNEEKKKKKWRESCTMTGPPVVHVVPGGGVEGPWVVVAVVDVAEHNVLVAGVDMDVVEHEQFSPAVLGNALRPLA